MGLEGIGCCGAYCGTCNIRRQQRCQGCKTGYADDTRDISRAKCRMKVCCIANQFTSCADCSEYESGRIIQSFHSKGSYKNRKYKEALDFIRANGYREFIKIADKWKMQYGKYE
jgi:hypothetical protein